MYFPNTITTKTSLPTLFACLSSCTHMYVCLFAYNSGTGGAVVSKFSVSQRWFYVQKFGKRVMGRGQKTGIFCFSQDCLAMHHSRQTGHWICYRCTHRCRQTMRRCDRNRLTLVVAGRHAYYTQVQEAVAFSGRKAEWGCLCYAQLSGQNG